MIVLSGDGWIFCFGFWNTKLYEESEIKCVPRIQADS